MSKFTEERLEQAIIELLKAEGYVHVLGQSIDRELNEVLIEEDLRAYLLKRYKEDHITTGEIDSVIRELAGFSAADLYVSNKAIMKMISDGFLLKREDRGRKDLYIQLIDYRNLEEQRIPQPTEIPTYDSRANGEAVHATEPDSYQATHNSYKIVNQLEITGSEKRIPDGIMYINGLPLVVFEFKSAIREEATIHDAYVQLTTRYRRDIPELLKYNAICVISDGVNNKAGSCFAPYESFSAWCGKRPFRLPPQNPKQSVQVKSVAPATIPTP